MNKLSWLIYGLELYQSLQVLLIISAAVAGILAAIAFVMWGLGFEFESNESEVPKHDVKAWRWSRRWFPRGSALCAFFTAVAVLLPSQSTVKLIVASEVTEQVIANPDVQEVVQNSKKILLKFLKEKAE